MESRFEVRFRHDRKTLREVFRATRRWWQPLLFCYAAATGAVLLAKLASGGEISATGWALLVLFASWGYAASPRAMARTAERNHRKRFGGELPEVTVAFSDEEIRLRECKDENHFDYAQVEKILRRRGLWLLIVAGRLMIPVPDAGYALGTPADFEKFIRGKCPRAKIG
ncbi:MAG: YcxB family protein [Alistipes sp.]|nr:YcxB family protein [Alistipes sp.]